jgi:hypothetical protein
MSLFHFSKKDPNQCVVDKLSKNPALKNKTKEEIIYYSKGLSDPLQIKQRYLNKEFEQIKSMFEEEKGEEKKKFSSNSELEILSNSIESTENGHGKNDVTKDVPSQEDLEDQVIEHKILDQHVKNNVIKSKLKIKFIVAEIVHSDRQLLARKFFSPITNAFGIGGQLGLFHSALVVGPWYLEWNNSSICIPRRCYSSAALLAIDLKENVIQEINVDEAIDKISKVICKWNTEKIYDRLTCNCQHFIDDLLKALGVTLKFQKTMGEFIKKIRGAGECKIEWKVPKELMEKCLIKEPIVTFETHVELDDFVAKVYEVFPLFHEKWPED